jgi:hypothetical protein
MTDHLRGRRHCEAVARAVALHGHDPRSGRQVSFYC